MNKNVSGDGIWPGNELPGTKNSWKSILTIWNWPKLSWQDLLWHHISWKSSGDKWIHKNRLLMLHQSSDIPHGQRVFLSQKNILRTIFIVAIWNWPQNATVADVRGVCGIFAIGLYHRAMPSNMHRLGVEGPKTPTFATHGRLVLAARKPESFCDARGCAKRTPTSHALNRAGHAASTMLWP